MKSMPLWFRGSKALAFTLVSLMVLLFVPSCSKREGQLATGKVVSWSEVERPSFVGDNAYAVVRRAALPQMQASFREVLSKRGLVKWDARFDCNRFSGLFINLAHVDYAVAAWHSNSPAQALALAEIWYRPDSGGKHSIVQALTEDGVIYWDVVLGQEVALSTAELNSIEFRQW